MGGPVYKNSRDTLRDVGSDTETVPRIYGAVRKHNISDSCLIEIEPAIKIICVIDIDRYILLGESKYLITYQSIESRVK